MAPSVREREERQGRFALLAGLVLGGFTLVVIGLLRLQVVEHGEYSDLAKENRVRLEVLRAPRGSIYDRAGELLADSAPSFSIVFRPFPAESVHLGRLALSEEYVRRVARLVNADTAEVRRRIGSANRTGRSEALARGAPFRILAAVEESRAEFPGIEVQVEPLRRYPHGTLASHLLGYANEINDVELDSLASAGYRPGDLIGRSGVERSYEELLRGRDGAEFVIVNARGKRVSMLEREPPRAPESGHDLVLTVDLAVQRAMEEAMADVERGAGVALDPRDGAVLGLVSRPAYDPNEFSRGISYARWRDLTRGDRNPLLNRAIQGVYPPGSTYKIVSMLSALEAGVSRPESRYQPCLGSYLFGGRRFGCWKREGHGSLDFIGALQHSCDTYFYQVGPRLGLQKLETSSRQMGLGERTGIDLPQERRGLIPDQAFYDRRWGPHQWRPGLMLNLAIGQGELLLTPIQMATMTAQVANGGRPVRPHVVREVRGLGRRGPGKPKNSGTTAAAGHLEAVRRGLEKVVTEGTGTASRVQGVRVAGKTGTAQNPHGEDHALFVCYAPAEAPVIVLAFVIENSGHGGSVAAPIAGHVLRRLFLPDSLQTPRPRIRPVARVSPAGDSLEVPDGD